MAPPELIPNGIPLAEAPGFTSRQLRVLRDSWIVTVQEFVALAHCPDVVRQPLARAHGVDLARLDALAQAAEAVIPPTRDARSLRLEAEAAAADYGRGALLEESAAERARRRALPPYAPAAGRRVLPPASDLLDQLSELRSQGPRGTCVAHAVLAVREQLEIAAGADRQINLSEQFVYWWCKAHDGIPQRTGTYITVGMRCLREVGAPFEALWPYVRDPIGPDEGQGPPPAACAHGDPALRTARTIEFNPTDIAGIKACLAEGRAVAFSVPVFDSWFYSATTRRWGKITLPLRGEAEDGGHAMTLVGYQDDPTVPGGGYFLVRNSWQPWAYDGVWQEGYGVIPYAYVRRYADAVFSATRLTAAAIYARDAADDDGRRPLARPTWNSPDIWLRQADAEPTGAHQRARPKAENNVFVRVFNPGPAYVYNVPCELFVAAIAPWVRPADWQRIGQTTIAAIAPGSHLCGPFSWHAPATETGQFAFRVRLTGKDDQPSPVYTSQAVERHLWLAEAAAGATVEITFDVYGLAVPGQITVLRVERAGLPAHAIITAAPAAPTPRLPAADDVIATLTADEQRHIRLLFTVPADAAPGTVYTFSVAQFVGETIAGRMPVEVRVMG